MRYASRASIFTAIATAAFLALAVATASAGHFKSSELRFTDKWTSLEFTAGTNITRCPVTLEGSYHSATMGKVEGALTGYITRASVTATSCTGGSATILTATLPWPIFYEGFEGTLPAIRTIRTKLVRASFEVQPSGSLICLAEATAERPVRSTLTLSSGTATSLTVEERAEIPLRGSLGACAFAGAGHFSGTTSSLTALGSTARITVTLI